MHPGRYIPGSIKMCGIIMNMNELYFYPMGDYTDNIKMCYHVYMCSKCTISCYEGVGYFPLDHSVLVQSDICHLGCHRDMRAYVWRT